MSVIQTARGKSRKLILCAGIFIVLSALLSACPGWLPQRQIDKGTAAKRIISALVEDIWETADRRIGLRVHQYPDLVPKGARIQPALLDKPDESLGLVCKNPSWLFFIDEQPGAHFTHPVRFALLDAKTGELQEVKADRWPLIDGRPVFDTAEKRADVTTTIFERPPQILPQGESLMEILGGRTPQAPTHDPCDAWAIIVCGYDDISDTFDEDTDDIYGVLTGLGLHDDHIFFTSPHTTHTGVDRATSIANVQWAINQVSADADETDKVLFFYSSHGGVDALDCVPGSPGGGTITATDLDTWLDTITCGEMVIIIEACHSGSLIGSYADGTYTATEDDLTGDGETNRCIFTSASSNTSSYPDVDWPGDPNPADVGSETIHGYIEAFSVAAADVDSDGEISFGEGWQYAWDNDVTRINGVNTPQMMHTGLVADDVYDYCYRITGAGDLFIADGPADVGNNSYDYNSTDIWVTQDPSDTDHQDVVSGMDNLVHVAVHNRGTTTIANGSLAVYWADVSTATSWPSSFTQIGAMHSFSGLTSGDIHTHTWTWYVDPLLGVGHNFCLVAVADSPDDPMTGGPPGITYVAPYDNNIAQKNITIIPSHSGHETLDFVLRNNTRSLDTVDLAVEWVGRPWGSAIFLFPATLTDSIIGSANLNDMKIVDVPGRDVSGFQVTGDAGGWIREIPLSPGESRIVSVMMETESTKPGQRSELRIIQMADEDAVGKVRVRLQGVDTSDCGWVSRLSVESFADLAVRFDMSSPREVNRLFATAVAKGLCQKEENMLQLLQEALSIEKNVGRSIPPETNPDAHKRFMTGLEELQQAIEARSVTSALEAQGTVAEAARDLSR